MELQDFDIELIEKTRLFVEGTKYILKLYLTRTNFMPRYYNDFKKYPSKQYPFFVLCHKWSARRRIALFHTEKEARKFYQEIINKSKTCTNAEFYEYFQTHMLRNRQLGRKYGRF